MCAMFNGVDDRQLLRTVLIYDEEKTRSEADLLQSFINTACECSQMPISAASKKRLVVGYSGILFALSKSDFGTFLI